MSEPFLAEIRMFGFDFAPRNWALCDGQILPINQNQALFSLLGTTYGGDGRTTFALPDLRGRAPVHEGTGVSSSFKLGQKGGEETHTLSTAEIPSHDHDWEAVSASGNQPVPTGASLAAYANGYGGAGSLVSPVAGTLANGGGGSGHNNMQPNLVISFCIALQGLFPSRN